MTDKQKLLKPLVEAYASSIIDKITENAYIECLEKGCYSCVYENNEAIEKMLFDLIGEVDNDR